MGLLGQNTDSSLLEENMLRFPLWGGGPSLTRQLCRECPFQAWYSIHQGSGVVVSRGRQNLLRLARFHDFALIHHRDLVSDMPHDGDIVGNEQVGQAVLVLQIKQQV